MTDLPIATMRREIGLSNDGLCLTPWKVKTTSSEEARWAMQALASADLFSNAKDAEKWGWESISDGYLRHLETYSGPSTTIAMALSAANTVSTLSCSHVATHRRQSRGCAMSEEGPWSGAHSQWKAGQGQVQYRIGVPVEVFRELGVVT